MRFGELCLGLAVVTAGGLARADRIPEDVVPTEPPKEEPAKPPEPSPAAPGPAEPEPTFGKPTQGPSQQEIDDMTPLPTPPAAASVTGNPQTGFAVGLELTTSTALTSQLTTGSSLGGRFWFGRHGETFTWGIGFQFVRASHYDNSSQTATQTALDESITTIVLEPNISMILTRSKDRRTELLLRASLGYGFSFYTDNDDTTADPSDVEVIRFGIAPELRHWVTDSFAVGAHAGPQWEHRGRQNDPGEGTNTVTDSAWEVDGALQMMGVF